MPGVIAAFLFVFIPTLGEFVTRHWWGGVSGYMYGNQMVDLFGTGFPDWLRPARYWRFFLQIVVALLDDGLCTLPAAPAGRGGLMDVALSKQGA